MKLATTGSTVAPTGHGLAPREPQLLGEQARGDHEVGKRGGPQNWLKGNRSCGRGVSGEPQHRQVQGV